MSQFSIISTTILAFTNKIHHPLDILLLDFHISIATSGVMSSMAKGCCVFSYDEIQKATNYFDDSNVIGKGGQGKVYKGTLSDGRNMIHVAVKCLELTSTEFQREIDMFSSLHHANLVALIGYCQENDSKILVYEFMVNGSLSYNIYKTGCCFLSWDQRLKICIGAACGLDFLHTGISNEFKIIHRDVKPANILLDENFNPKISDFGLSRRGPANQTRSAVSTAKRGTPGYYAPEYLKTGRITIKVDVYAFGLVLFEVLCGKSSWEHDDSNVKPSSVSQWAYENIDKFIEGAISTSCLKMFIDIAEKCVNKDPSHRPTMNQVVTKLEEAQKLQFSSKSGNTSTRREPNGENKSYKYLPTIPESKTQKDVSSKGEKVKLADTGSSMTRSSRRTTLPDIPGLERKIVLYSSLQTLTDGHKIRQCLNFYRVGIEEERDPTTNERHEAELRGFFSRTSRQYCLPQLFIGGRCVGGADEVDRLYYSGELKVLLSELSQV